MKWQFLFFKYKTFAHFVCDKLNKPYILPNFTWWQFIFSFVNKGKETDATKLFRISNCLKHPLYKDYHNDIAVCKIEGTIQYSSKVGPVCLPFHHYRNSFDGSKVTALGQYRFPIIFFLCFFLLYIIFPTIFTISLYCRIPI